MPVIPPSRALAVLGFVVAIGLPSPVFETRCDASSPPASLIPEWKNQAVLLLQGGCAERAAKLAREAYELSLIRLGGADPNTTDARSLLALAERFVALSRRDREVAARLWAAETRLEATLDSDSLSTARPIADDILRRTTQLLGPGTIREFHQLALLAVIDYQLGRLISAEEEYRRAAELGASIWGPDHENVLAAIGNQLAVMGEQGRQLEAEPRMVELLERKRRLLPPWDDSLLSNEMNLANLFVDVGRYAQAESIFTRLMSEGTREGDRKFSRRIEAILLNNLGVLYEQTERIADAERTHRTAIAINRELRRPAHELLPALVNLGALLQRNERLEEAEKILDEAIAIGRAASLPETNGSMLHALSSRARLRIKTGDPDRGVGELEGLLSKLAAARTKQDLDYSIVVDRLCDACRERDDYARADRLAREVLETRKSLLGPHHRLVADSYRSLAGIASERGRAADAEGFMRRAVAIQVEAEGPVADRSLEFLQVLAKVLKDCGKSEESERRVRSILAETARSGRSRAIRTDALQLLATLLAERGENREAVEIHRQVLAARRVVLPPSDHRVLVEMMNLATALDGSREPKEALAILDEALRLADGNPAPSPLTRAAIQSRKAPIFASLNEFAIAERHHREVVEIRRKHLGDTHPLTIHSSINLAIQLRNQHRWDESIPLLRAAAVAHETARAAGGGGLAGADSPLESPHAFLALGLIATGKHDEAWTWYERGLARSLVDELAGGARQSMTPQERADEAKLETEIEAIDNRIAVLRARDALDQAAERNLADLLVRANEARARASEFRRGMIERHGVFAGRASSLEEVRASLDDSSALVGWLDVGLDHWAVVIKKRGAIEWIRLPGSGADGAWTNEELGREGDLHEALSARDDRRDPLAKARAVADLRWRPLRPALVGIDRIIVTRFTERSTRSSSLSKIPIDLLIEVGSEPGDRRPVVIEGLSGSVYAHKRKARNDRDPANGRILVVADPVGRISEPATPIPPEAGAVISKAIENRNAQLHGLTRGDVVIAYNGRPTPNGEQLQVVPADPNRPRVGLKYWRGGVVHEVEVASGPLWIFFDKRSPRVFHAALAEARRIQLRSGLRPLPAARWEAELIAREFGRDRSRVLLGAEAKESAIQAAATSGELASYRILHFAVHGAAEQRRAFGTSIYLAPDGNGVEIESDGVVSAEQVARTWNLDADLVVLSACEASNGLELEGQGLLGFVQPLLAKGARTVVASHWRVDDTASALLMMLFYDQLLGKGLAAGKALPAAEALQAAKDRIRRATLKEIRAMIAARGLDAKIDVRADGPEDARPFASPRYWAAFQIYGAPGEKAGVPIVGRVE